MLASLHKPLRAIILLPAFITALTIAGNGSPQNSPRASTQPTSDAHIYFPPEQTSIPIFAVILPSLGEPSLFEAAKDANTVSVRVSYFSPMPTREAAIRLVVNADGSGRITSVASSGTLAEVKRTQSGAAAADVNKLLQLLEKVGFWSMPSTEDTKQKTDSAGRKVYVNDGSFWMVEGVREGSFHYAYRQNPRPNPIQEIGCFMAKELEKPDDSVITIPGCTSPRQ